VGNTCGIVTDATEVYMLGKNGFKMYNNVLF